MRELSDLKFPFPTRRVGSGLLVAGLCGGSEGGSDCPNGNFWRKSSHMIIPHYWNPAGRAVSGLPGGPGASPRPGGGAHHVAVRAACRRDRGPGVAGHRSHGRLPRLTPPSGWLSGSAACLANQQPDEVAYGRQANLDLCRDRGVGNGAMNSALQRERHRSQ